MLLCLVILGASVPAYATTPPQGQPDPGQTAAYRKLYAVAINAYNRKLLPKSAVTAAKKLGVGVKPGDQASNAANRQAFWLLVASDVEMTTGSMVDALKSGKSIRDLAGSKNWKQVRDDARAWATHELDIELFPDPISHKPLISPKRYMPIRARVFAATDKILTVKVPKPKPTQKPTPKPTPKPKPTKTPKPTPSPTPTKKPTPKPSPSRGAQVPGDQG
jgi:cell division septation protein DedD